VGCGDTTSDPHVTQLFQFLQRISEHGKPRHVHLCADKDCLQLHSQMPLPVFLVPHGSHEDLAKALTDIYIFTPIYQSLGERRTCEQERQTLEGVTQGDRLNADVTCTNRIPSATSNGIGLCLGFRAILYCLTKSISMKFGIAQYSRLAYQRGSLPFAADILRCFQGLG
jgi:hypothetical protein